MYVKLIYQMNECEQTHNKYPVNGLFKAPNKYLMALQVQISYSAIPTISGEILGRDARCHKASLFMFLCLQVLSQSMIRSCVRGQLHFVVYDRHAIMSSIVFFSSAFLFSIVSVMLADVRFH